jgi:glutamate dehydrogenase
MSTQPSLSNVLLLPLNQQIDANYSKTRAAVLKQFARQYFASTSQTELGKMTEEELFQSLSDAWDFLQERKSARPKIRFVARKLAKDKKRQTGTSIYLLLDDMPFLVDSVRQCLNRIGVVVRNVHNCVLFVERDGKGRANSGRLKKIAQGKSEGHRAEALSCINCAHLTEAQVKDVEAEIRAALNHVFAAVSDYQPMCNRARSIQNALLANSKFAPVSQDEVKESSEFISWLLDNHFTFLGYEEYRIRNLKQGKVMELQENSLLGVSRLKTDLKKRVNLNSLPSGTANLILKKQVCNFAKSSNLSKVHRPVYQDYVLIKEFDSKGNVHIEHRFVGLYTCCR